MVSMSDDRKKRLLYVGGFGLVLVLATAAYQLASGNSAPPDPDANLADVQKAEAAKDAAKLSAAVGDADERKAAAAVGALARVGKRADAAPVIRRAMDDARPQVRQQAVRWYPRVADREDPQDVAVVRKAVTADKSKDVVIAGLKALGDMKAWDSLEAVYARMNDNDRTVRVAAALAAEEILFMPVTSHYRPDDPPAKRAAAIQYFRQISQKPGPRQMYLDWRKQAGKGGA